MRFLKFAQLVAKGFAKERACAAESKKQLSVLRDRVKALEAKLADSDEDVQSALDALDVLENQVDYTPVVDVVAEGLIDDPVITTVILKDVEGVSSPDVVTPPETAKAVIELAASRVVVAEGIEAEDADISPVAEAAEEEVLAIDA